MSDEMKEMTVSGEMKDVIIIVILSIQVCDFRFAR